MVLMKRKIGDLIFIKDWREMFSEFGMNEEEEIDCRCTFTEPMRFMCNNVYRIEKLNSDSYNVFDIKNNHHLYYYISDDMIKDIDFDKHFIIPL